MAALVAVVFGVSGSLMLNRTSSRADTAAINFESGYADGTVHNQDGWSSSGAAGSGCAVYDHQVVTNAGAPVSFGTKSLRVSNAVTSGCFGDQTYSKSLLNEAGETLATNNSMSGGTRQNHFDVSWDIVSTKATQQPGLFVSFSPDRGDGGRMSYLGVEDQAGGLRVNFYDVPNTGPCVGGCDFVETVVATNLDRTTPHNLRLVMDLLDGPNNDVVKVYIDGVLKHTGTSWESYFRYDTESAAEQSTRTVDSLLIRTGGTAVPANAGFGFLIDNINETSSLLPPPPTTTTVVKSVDLTAPAGGGWLFYNDETDTFDNTPGVLGSFVFGPGSAPLGNGSVQISVAGTQRRNLATYQFSGTPLASITELKYSTYNATSPSGPNSSGYINFNVDFNLSDTWQRRLIFLPADNGGVTLNTWQEWDAINSGAALWRYSGPTWPAPNGALAGSTPLTWNDILTDYPNVRMRVTDSHFGIRVGEPYALGYTENLDKVIFATDTARTVFDFEPNNPCTTLCYVRTTGNDSNDGSTPATAKLTIQGGVNAVSAGGTVDVGPGTYNEDVNINKAGVLVKGAGIGSTIVVGPIGGDGATLRASALGVIIEGFSITRAGNNLVDWNNTGLNSAGVAVQGLTASVELRDSHLYGNRTGVDVNNSNGNNIHNNIIDDNRTGLIFRNQTDNTLLKNNFITNNWTVGIVFLDASGGTNVPVQQALNSQFNENDLSGNWYGAIAERQTGGSLPAPGTNLKNFENNWWGTIAPVVTTANSAEPGYAAQIPVAYGGSATAPGGQPDIAGAASANVDHAPLLCSGTDVQPSTTGFQPLFDCGDIEVTSTSAFTGDTNVQVQVRANSVESLWGAQAYLTYDSTRLTLTGVQLGGGLDPDYVALNSVAPGLISFAFSQTSGSPVTGTNVVLATLTFTATATGVANIDYQVGQTQLFSNNLGQPMGPLNRVAGAVTITNAPPGTGDVAGTILLQGRGNHAGATAEINPPAFPGVGSPLTTTASNGAFTIVAAPQGGAIVVRARMLGYLLATKTMAVVAGSNAAGSITLLGGDANMSGTINILDLSLVAAYFGQTGPGFVPAVAANTTPDINGDSVVNILDLSLTAANFGASGPTAW